MVRDAAGRVMPALTDVVVVVQVTIFDFAAFWLPALYRQTDSVPDSSDENFTRLAAPVLVLKRATTCLPFVSVDWKASTLAWSEVVSVESLACGWASIEASRYP